DSSMALSRVIDSGEYDVRYLFTTVNELYGRVSMHGVREELLDMQAESIGIPLVKCYLPVDVTMGSYEESMRAALDSFKK
ncbi:MAG TPA: ATP-binding protein, partial [Spirochaetota bacterium]|nr:ATP-binding protein [Spirochaetota bacterium]